METGGPDVEPMALALAARRYEVSHRTLRRLVTTGRLPGAMQVRGRHGLEWRVPPSALERAGYRPRDASTPAELGTLARAVRMLAQEVGELRRDNARLNREWSGAVFEAASLRSELSVERGRRLRIEARLRALPSPREVDLTERIDLTERGDRGERGDSGERAHPAERKPEQAARTEGRRPRA